MAKNEPVQILSKESGTLKLDERALKRVLECSWDKPTAIISICGDKRKGKSFLINLLLRDLTENLQDKIEGKLLGKWLEPAFEWRGGPDRNTEGIWITSKPINLPTRDGSIALYIMDTQGMFDNKTTKQECAQIFTLSTLMSSVLVFNLLRQLQSNDIEQLAFWTKSADWVGNDQSTPVLQNLVLLIRDFPHAHLGYGTTGGKKYLDSQISEALENKEVTGNLNDLRKIFQTVSAFAMPSPGSKIEKRDESVKQIKMKAIDGKFLKLSKELFKQMRNDVLPLQLNQIPMTGQTFYEYIVKCGSHILSGKMPHSKDLSDLVADHWLKDLVKKLVTEYNTKMDQILVAFHGGYDEFKEMHDKEKAAVIKLFEGKKKFGRGAVIQDARNLMTKEIEEHFATLSRNAKELSDARAREAYLVQHLAEVEEKYEELAEQHREDAQKAEELEEKKKELEEKVEELQLATLTSNTVMEQKKQQIAMLAEQRKEDAQKAKELEEKKKELEKEVKGLQSTTLTSNTEMQKQNQQIAMLIQEVKRLQTKTHSYRETKETSSSWFPFLWNSSKETVDRSYD